LVERFTPWMAYAIDSGGEVLEDDERTPSVSSVAWKKLSQSVLELLAAPQDWDTMEAWVQHHQFGGTRFRHVLAWLEEKHLATTFVRKEPDANGLPREKLYWVSTTWVARVSERPPRPRSG